jgi:hydrogenase maturation protease
MHLMRDPLPRAQRGTRVSRVVIGMGNTFRRDDGAGVEVARRLRRLAPSDVTVLEHDGEPAGLLDAWEGADVAYVVDSVRGDNPGAVHHLQLSAHHAIPAGHDQGSTHTLGLGEAVELARVLDRLPPTLTIIGIEGVDFSTGEGLSQEVGRATVAVANDLAQRLATADPINS